MNKEYHIIGLMSGTSLDGVDIVKCTFLNNGDWSFNLNKFETIHYSKYWKEKLEKLHTKSKKEIRDCDKEYGKLLADICNHFIKKNNLKVDYISSHGHTIFHQPEKKYTLQIGCGKTIADTTNITTINNFRELDVSLGGQGLQLVPIGDLYLFPEFIILFKFGRF